MLTGVEDSFDYISPPWYEYIALFFALGNIIYLWAIMINVSLNSVNMFTFYFHNV